MSIVESQTSTQSTNRKINIIQEQKQVVSYSEGVLFCSGFYFGLFFLLSSKFPLFIYFCISEFRNPLSLYTERHKHSQRSTGTGHLLFHVCERICTDTPREPRHHVMTLSTHPGKPRLWLIEHCNYKQSALQYIWQLDTPDFSPGFAHTFVWEPTTLHSWLSRC